MMLQHQPLEGGVNMDREFEDQVAAEIEASDDDAWVADPAPEVAQRPLGAQITIRLSPEIASKMRALARARGVGYTSLVRAFVEEHLREQDFRGPRIMVPSRAELAGEQVVQDANSSYFVGESLVTR